MGLHVAGRAGLAAADLQNQLADALDHLQRACRIHAALVAVTGIGAEVIAARTAGHGLGPPESDLDIHILRVIAHRSGIATHDAGQRFHFLVVGDHAHGVVQRHGVAVEQLELFARLAPAHVQGRAGNLVGVEDVRRLAQLEHHVVGDVHQGRHAALAAARQTVHHPGGRLRIGIHAGDHAAAEAPAQIGRLHVHLHLRAGRHRHLRFGQGLQRRAGQGRHFARHAVHAQAVRQVGRELEGEQGVVQIQVFANVLANRRISCQFQQAAVVFGQLQFACRAQHAVALHATQFAHLDLEGLAILAGRQFGAHQRAGHTDADAGVRCAADDLQQLRLADIHLAHAQAVGIGVLFGFLDLADHDGGEGRRHGRQLFHFQAGHGQGIGQLLGGERRVAEAAEPGFGKLHGVLGKFGGRSDNGAWQGGAPGAAAGISGTG